MKKRGKSILKFVTPSVCKEEALPAGNGNTGVLIFGGAKRDTVRFCVAGLSETKVVPNASKISNFDCDKNCSQCRCSMSCPYSNNTQENTYQEKEKILQEMVNCGQNDGVCGHKNTLLAENNQIAQEISEIKDSEEISDNNIVNTIENNVSDIEKETSIGVNDEYEKNTDFFPDVTAEYLKTKQLVGEGKFVEAQNVMVDKILSSGTKSVEKSPIAVCNLEFDFEVACRVTDYYRALDMQTGEVKVYFEDEKGAILRNSFVACKNDFFVSRISSTGSKKANFSYWVANAKEYDENDEVDVQDNVMTYISNTKDNKKVGIVLKFSLSGGSFEKHGKKIVINGAEEVLILAKAFVCENSDDKDLIDTQKVVSKMKDSYENLFLEQKEVFATKMSFPQLDLGGVECDCVEKMILMAKSGEVTPDFVEKLCKFGNYLFAISGESLFHFPCGVFDLCLGQTNHYLQLENLMFPSYFGGNVSPEAFFDKYFEKIDNYKTLCKKMFGFEGLFVPSLQREDGMPSFIEGQNLFNNNVAGLLCIFVYKHYLRTLDLNFLKKSYEFLLKTGEFYSNFLVENKQTKTLESPYGISPYSRPKGKVFYLSPNPMVDFSTAKSVFKILTNVCQILGEEENASKFDKLLSLVPDVQVDNFGLIKEYNLNGLETDETSPFISHLVPYCVGAKRFDAKKDYETLVANSIKSRFLNSTGKYRSNDLCRMALALFACGEGSDGYEILKTLIKNFISSNLMFSLYDRLGQGVGLVGNKNELPFDTNIMLFSCVKNMFVKSCGSDIFLFDSFPKEFKKCSIRGVPLDGGVVCEMWVSTRGVLRLRLKASSDTTVNVYMPRGTKRVKVRGVLFDYQQNAILGLSLKKNKKKKIKVYFEC